MPTVTIADDSAFPASESGLTKLEYMASALMAGLLAHSGLTDDPDDLAEQALVCADALIRALNKPIE